MDGFNHNYPSREQDFKMPVQLIYDIKSSKLCSEAHMQDRRKLPRKDLMSYSQVFDLAQGKLIGYLGDLNLLGAMVIGDEVLKVGEKLTISIQLPELPRITATRLAVPVRVVWCHQDLSPEYFNIGLEFEIVTDEQRKVIEAVLENYEFRRQPPSYPPHPVDPERE
jgi:Tfp pilus assembly protein PilZ